MNKSTNNVLIVLKNISCAMNNKNSMEDGVTSASICLRAPDKALFQPKVLILFLFLHENLCCGFSLEMPQ